MKARPEGGAFGGERSTMWIFVFAFVALAGCAAATSWVLQRPSTWTRCDRGVECSGGIGCRCVEQK